MPIIKILFLLNVINAHNQRDKQREKIVKLKNNLYLIVILYSHIFHEKNCKTMSDLSSKHVYDLMVLESLENNPIQITIHSYASNIPL